MKTALLRKACRHFARYDVPREVRHNYIRQWMRSVDLLADKYLFAQPIARKA